MILTEAELKTTYYKKAANVDATDLTTYLARANAFAVGVIGGEPIPADDVTVKVAIAMAFEIFAQGETAQADDLTGNITEGAPTGFYARKAKNDPLDIVREMLGPARRAFEDGNTATSDRGVQFL